MLIITAEWHAFAIYTMMTNRVIPKHYQGAKTLAQQINGKQKNPCERLRYLCKTCLR